MKLSKEIKAVLFVFGGIFLFLIGYNFLDGTSLFKSENKLYTIYNQVEGLHSGTKVTVNGLTIGKVTNIDFLSGTDKILVSFTVRSDLEFSKNSMAELYEAGLIGGKSIAVIPVYDNTVVQTGDTLLSRVKPGFTDVIGEEIITLQVKLEALLTNADILFSSLNNIMDDKAQKELNKALIGVSVTVDNLNSASQSLSKILTNQKGNINKSFENIANISDNLNKVSDSLATTNVKQMINEFEIVAVKLNKVLTSIESGEGSMGKLLKDEALYNNLVNSTKEVELLVKDLKEHPKRYVHFSLFGKKEKPYKPEPENEE